MPRLAIANRTALAQPAAIVRSAAHDEYALIAHLLLRANLEYRTRVSPAIFGAYVRDLQTLTQSWANKDFLVAELDGKLVGAVAFYREASAIGFNLPQEWAGLRALAVDPAARGRGIGRQLTEACALRAWRIGRAAICLHNAPFQKAALKLHRSMGFARCPRYDIAASDLLGAVGERIPIAAFCLDLRSAAARSSPFDLEHG